MSQIMLHTVSQVFVLCFLSGLCTFCTVISASTVIFLLTIKMSLLETTILLSIILLNRALGQQWSWGPKCLHTPTNKPLNPKNPRNIQTLETLGFSKLKFIFPLCFFQKAPPKIQKTHEVPIFLISGNTNTKLRVPKIHCYFKRNAYIYIWFGP